MKPFDEIDLAAYHLGDLSPRRARLLEEALQADARLAAESEVYASMLRNFKGHASLDVDEDTVDRNWRRIQSRLPRYGMPLRLSPRHMFAVAATGLTFVAAAIYVRTHLVAPVSPAAQPTVEAPAATRQHMIEEAPAIVANPPAHGRHVPSKRSELSRLIADAKVLTPLIVPDLDSPRAASQDKDRVTAPRPAPPPTQSPVPLVSSTPPSSNEAAGNARMAQSGTTKGHRRNGFSQHHEHTTDVTLAMGGVLMPTRSLNAGGATQVTGGTHAVSAIGSFHQQWRPLAGYRLTASYTRPDFNFENSSYGGVHINARIYELAGTYVVQGPRRGFLSTAVEAGAGLMTILPTESALYTKTDRRVAAIVGATAEVALSKHVAVQAGYRLQVFHSPNFQVSGSLFPLPTPVAASTLFSNEPSLGITYRFSRK